ncbi:MAG: HAD family hydrolase [Patescibacteria group bacterium]|jgi:pyrophosphatase PpaX
MKDKVIKAVIFDIDGVLLDSFEANLKFFQNIFQASGYAPPSRKDYEQMFHLSMLDVIKKISGSADEKEVMRIFNLGKDRAHFFPFELLKIPKDSESTLKALSKKYVLSITTSRVKEGVWPVPQLATLQKYFKVAVTYEDTEKHKPHPAPLLLTSEKMNVKPGEAVYIGDAETDIIAAKAAGMKVIIYSKKIITGANFCTSSFKKIPELVKKCS